MFRKVNQLNSILLLRITVYNTLANPKLLIYIQVLTSYFAFLYNTFFLEFLIK